MSQPQTTTENESLSPAEAARRARVSRRRRIIGYSILAMLILPPLVDVVSDPYGEVADWYYAAALENYASGKPDQAEKLLAQSLNWSPKTEPRVHVARASHLFSKDAYEEAVAEINKAMAIAGETISLLIVRAECYQRLKQPEQAVADWNSIMQIGMKPTFLDQWMPSWRRGREADLLNAVAFAKAVGDIQLHEGLQQAEQSLKLIPRKAIDQRAMVLDTRGFLHYRLGNYPAALQDINEAVDILEGLVQEHADELAKQEHNDAIRERRYQALLRQANKGLVVILYHRALVHEALSHAAEARADRNRVRQILGREPDESLF